MISPVSLLVLAVVAVSVVPPSNAKYFSSHARTAEAIGQAIDELIKGIQDSDAVEIVSGALDLAKSIVATAGGKRWAAAPIAYRGKDDRSFAKIGSAIDELIKGIENDDAVDIVSGVLDLVKEIVSTSLGKRDAHFAVERSFADIGSAIDELIKGIESGDAVDIVSGALDLAKGIVSTALGQRSARVPVRSFKDIGSAVDELIKGIGNDDAVDIVSGVLDLVKSIFATAMGQRAIL